MITAVLSKIKEPDFHMLLNGTSVIAAIWGTLKSTCNDPMTATIRDTGGTLQFLHPDEITYAEVDNGNS